jgi:hypothetical protein
MEEYEKLMESLLEKAADYGKTSFELAKLKAIDKTSEVVSSLAPKLVVLVLIATGLLFLNFGLAVWLGDIFGKLSYGFFAVATFYCFSGIVVRFFMFDWLKKVVRNGFIKQVLK